MTELAVVGDLVDVEINVAGGGVGEPFVDQPLRASRRSRRCGRSPRGIWSMPSTPIARRQVK